MAATPPDPNTPIHSFEKSPFGCPSCHSYAIYRSRLKGMERVKKYFTVERPYRCHDCGWRGWLENIRYSPYPLPTANDPHHDK